MAVIESSVADDDHRKVVGKQQDHDDDVDFVAFKVSAKSLDIVGTKGAGDGGEDAIVKVDGNEEIPSPSDDAIVDDSTVGGTTNDGHGTGTTNAAANEDEYPKKALDSDVSGTEGDAADGLAGACVPSPPPPLPPAATDLSTDRFVTPKDFELMRVIGMGAFGKVLQVRNKRSRQILAMKVISKRLLRRKVGYIENVQAERKILTRVRHPFVVTMHCSFQTREKLFIIMDFLAGGELFLRIGREGLFLEKTAAFYLGEIILALDHLHTLGILHRDLKPENVLLGSDGHVCLTDFGLAKDFSDGSGTAHGDGDDGDGDSEPRALTICGTQEYMAPEMIARKGYGRAADYWSLGCIAYEMLSGRPPFESKKGAKELFRKIMQEKVKMPDGSTAAACKLLKGLLNRNVQSRLGTARSTMFEVGGIAGLKKSDFFKDLDWEKLEQKEIDPPKDLAVQNEEDLCNFHEEFTGMTLPRSVIEMSHERFQPRRVDSESFRGFSFIQADFLLPEREKDEVESYWNSVEEDGESVSECASSKMCGLDDEGDHERPPGEPSIMDKKKRPPRKRKKKVGGGGSTHGSAVGNGEPVMATSSVAPTPATSAANTPVPSEHGDADGACAADLVENVKKEVADMKIAEVQPSNEKKGGDTTGGVNSVQKKPPVSAVPVNVRTHPAPQPPPKPVARKEEVWVSAGGGGSKKNAMKRSTNAQSQQQSRYPSQTRSSPVVREAPTNSRATTARPGGWQQQQQQQQPVVVGQNRGRWGDMQQQQQQQTTNTKKQGQGGWVVGMGPASASLTRGSNMNPRNAVANTAATPSNSINHNHTVASQQHGVVGNHQKNQSRWNPPGASASWKPQSSNPDTRSWAAQARSKGGTGAVTAPTAPSTDWRQHTMSPRSPHKQLTILPNRSSSSGVVPMAPQLSVVTSKQPPSTTTKQTTPISWPSLSSSPTIKSITPSSQKGNGGTTVKPSPAKLQGAWASRSGIKTNKS